MHYVQKQFFLLFFLLIGILPVHARAFVDEGPVLWESGGDVMQRFHSEVFGTLGSPSIAIAGVNAKFIIAKASPIAQDFVLGVQDSGGILHVYHSADGKNWIADWTASVGDSNVARFDIAYEQTTGRAVIAYRGRILGNKSTFYYRTWSGGAWSGQLERTNGPTSGNIIAIKMAARPNSNQLGLAYLDDTRSGSAAFWNGSSWQYYGNRITNNATVYTGFNGIYPPMRGMDVSFEALSGDMLVVMGENSSNRARWITRSAGGTWSAIGSLTALSGYGDFMRLVPSPSTNEIILSTCTMEPSVAQYLCEFDMWSGTSFGAPSVDASVNPINDGQMPTDAFWLVDGANRAAVAVYGNDVTNGIDWYLSVNGGSFVAQPTNATSPTTITGEGQIMALPISGAPSQALLFIDDASNVGYMKRVTLSGTSVSFASVAPGSVPELTTWAYPVPDSMYARMGAALQNAPALFIASTTAANTTTPLPSGGTAYIADPLCVGQGDCSGYVFHARGQTPITLSRVLLTNTGTANLAETSGWSLDIDTDANPNNGITQSITGVVSGNTVTFSFSPSLTLNPGDTFYVFPKATYANAGVSPSVGQTITLVINSINDIDTSASPLDDEYLVGTPTVRGVIAPNMTDYVNTSENTLSYASGCVNCGGRLGIGASAQTITINGFGFGADPGVGNRATAQNRVSIRGATETTISDANVVSWSNTQIVINLDASVSGNADTDFGANYGGVGALSVTASGVSAGGLDFYLFPQITGLLVPVGLGPDGAKEFATGDTDGVITLLGTRFGANQGAGLVRILGCSVTTCTAPIDSVVIESWGNTAVKVEVPAVIPDNLYVGTITLVRDFPVANAASVDYANPFHVRPRLLSITPTSGGAGDAITLTGNHFCPSGDGVCPAGTVGIDGDVTLPPAFSSADQVIVGGAVADYWGSWADTSVVTEVPFGASIGATVASLTAGTFFAGQLSFNVLNNNQPAAPSGLTQYATTTQNTSMLGGTNPTPGMSVLNVGGATWANTVFFGGVLTSSSGVSGSMRLAVEVQPIGTTFVCGQSVCASEVLGPAVPGPGTIDCNVDANNCKVAVPVSENAYHWQARIEYTAGTKTFYGPWAAYPSLSPNLETAADFLVDRTPPSIINISAGTPTTNGATITWNTNEPATQLIELNKTGIFSDNCDAASGCQAESLSLTLDHNASLVNLDSNTLYYYRLYASDAAGNHTWSSVQQFTTLGVSQPSKTVYFGVLSNGDIVQSGGSATSTFSIVIPEQSIQYQSIFLDIRGIYGTSGATANASLSVKVDNESSVTYALPGGRTILSPWRLYHKVSALLLSPGTNTIEVTAGPDTTLYGVGADIIVTYSYTP